MSTMRKADVLIVGGGPAGLSAALSLSRTRSTTVLFDSGVYRNANTEFMHTVPTYDHTRPADYRKAAREELQSRYGDTFQYVQRKALKLRKVQGPDTPRPFFQVDDDQGETWTGRKVVLATGIQDKLPSIPGFDKVWGRSIVHCVYCHGTETRGKPIAILFDPTSNINGKTLSMFIQKFNRLDNNPVTILANGYFGDATAPKAIPEHGITAELLQIIKNKGYRWELRPVASITSDENNPEHSLTTVYFSDGGSFTVPFIVYSPLTVAPPSTVELLSDPSVSVIKEGLSRPNPMFGTSLGEIPSSGFMPVTEIPGIYAAGNATMFMATILGSTSAGQLAGVGADQEIGVEDEQDAAKAAQAASA